LSSTASFLKDYPSLKVTVEGHCDERGSTEYNLGLGQRRADAVKQYLTSLGIAPDRLTTVSFCKEKPVCAEHGEHCWQQHRRGDFVKGNGAGRRRRHCRWTCDDRLVTKGPRGRANPCSLAALLIRVNAVSLACFCFHGALRRP